jgi:Transcriptional regulator PadR-like family
LVSAADTNSYNVDGLHHDANARFAALHARSADPAHAAERCPAWVGHFRANTADFPRVLQINQGSLYPALHRLEHQGWIEAEWKVSELGRRAKYYHLTASGRRQLAVEAREWERMANAIGRVMKFA